MKTTLTLLAITAIAAALFSPDAAAHTTTVLTLPSNDRPVIDPNIYVLPAHARPKLSDPLPMGMHTAARLDYPGAMVTLQGSPCDMPMNEPGDWHAFYQWQGEAETVPSGCWKTTPDSHIVLQWVVPEISRTQFDARRYALRFNPKPEYWGEGHDPMNVTAQAELRAALAHTPPAPTHPAILLPPGSYAPCSTGDYRACAKLAK